MEATYLSYYIYPLLLVFPGGDDLNQFHHLAHIYSKDSSFYQDFCSNAEWE
ncbi:hypothetical protein PVAG01_02398 [Phlyctema vagabunda]|uniref:Maturase K n=1 Tax=Phlyctema vagabunda TaxID=108571 RepID=A0ABR4PQH1_9HELO